MHCNISSAWAHCPCSKHETLGRPWGLATWKFQMLKFLLLFWPFCVAGAILQAQIWFPGKLKTLFSPSAQKEFSLGTVSFTLAVRNAGMEEYGLFWHDCCLASKAREAHVSLGSPFCRQLNPLCCQEVCLCGLCFWSALFSVPSATFQHVTPFSVVKSFVLFRQSFTECVSVLGFSSKANFQELRELFLCISFPGTVRAQKKKKNAV